MNTKCTQPDCDGAVFPGSRWCDNDHKQHQAAPMPPDMAIQTAVFDLLHRAHDFPATIEGSEDRALDVRAHIAAQIDALHEAQRLLDEYRLVKGALATLKDVLG